MAFLYKTEPLSHQARILQTKSDVSTYALFWEQGTGKTKPTIDKAVHLYQAGLIDALLVVAPPGVERNWKSDELPKHMADAVHDKAMVSVWQSGKAGTKWHAAEMERLLRHSTGMAVLLVSYNAFMTQRCKDYIWKFLRRRRVFYVLDEAHNIKTPAAKRTKSIVASGRYAPYKQILTGTPISIGPFDVYSQIKFLDEKFWVQRGFETFTAFKKHFGVWFTAAQHQDLHGWDPGYDKLIEFRHLEDLTAMLAEISDRVLKKDVLDLPPQLYSKRYFDLTLEQREIYDRLKADFEYEWQDGAVTSAPLAIVRLLRFQQVTCGYVGVDDEEPIRLIGKRNPRLELLEDITSNLHHPAIIWARFTKDVDQIMEMLGSRACRYDGKCSEDEKERSKLGFNDGTYDWFVGKAVSGGSGLTLLRGLTTVYYSNSFRLIDRLQSEDRPHRFGQVQPCHYIDLQATDTVDQGITKALREHRDIASLITGDELRDWI